MTRRRSTTLVALILAAWLAWPQPGTGQAPARPNIVVFVIDDSDIPSFAALYFNGLLPNLTKYFFTSGFGFAESFAVAGFGGPARATFLTGQYPHNHGVLGFRPNGVERMNASSTVATWLHAAGYRTGHIGRYVTGYGWWTNPRTIPPGWSDWKTLLDPDSNNTIKYRMNVNGTIVDVGGLAAGLGIELHQTDVVAYLANEFVRQAPAFNQPFFLMANPGTFNMAVNPPYNVCPGLDMPDYDPLYEGAAWGAAQQPAARHVGTIFGDEVRFPLWRSPAFTEPDISDKPVWTWVWRTGHFSEQIIDCIQKRYWRKLEGMRAVDDLVGTVMGALEETGQLSNTVAIFTGDNGWIDGDHRIAGRAVPYEGAIRVPLLYRPRQETPFRWISKLVFQTDLVPTIAQLAQATPTHAMDGRSLLPLIENPDGAPWRRVGLVNSVGDFDPESLHLLPPTFLAVRTDLTKPRMLATYPTIPLLFNGEFYDLVSDPYQLQNRYNDPAKAYEVGVLSLWLGALSTCRGAGCVYLENALTF